jgi:site-specific DNA-cytosine methylase
MKIGNVLSLFDGMSCGQIALERAGIEYDNYYASEIDKYAIKITQHNYPNTIQLGDVTKWKDWNIDWNSIDLILAGSPCQGFSFAGKQLAFDDDRSKLFFVFIDILNHIRKFNSNVDFLLENVRMKQEHQDVISQHLKVKPIMINSNLVSAQNRLRLYWTSIPNLGQPENKGILLRDILESGSVDRYKSLCLSKQIATNYGSQPYMRRRYFGKAFAQVVFEKGSALEHKTYWKKDPFGEFATQSYIRGLTILEMERLQTLPDNYTKVDGISPINQSQALGNGWTVDVIVHILKNLGQKNRFGAEQDLFSTVAIRGKV